MIVSDTLLPHAFCHGGDVGVARVETTGVLLAVRFVFPLCLKTLTRTAIIKGRSFIGVVEDLEPVVPSFLGRCGGVNALINRVHGVRGMRPCACRETICRTIAFSCSHWNWNRTNASCDIRVRKRDQVETRKNSRNVS